ncbi:MAG: endonuclease/exonuclease/phosphatase family protein [Pseudomonadota bacterium]
MATYNVELAREGPGLLLRDITRGEAEDILAALGVIAHVAPDVLVLTAFDYDHDAIALTAFADALSGLGADYPYRFAAAPNTGIQTSHDLDGDGYLGGPADAVGYGEFRGQGGMAVLSRWPVDVAGVQDLSSVIWSDLPGAIPPDGPYGALSLSTTAHWDVPVLTPAHGTLRVLSFHASPPVFDGPEDRNGRRNHDETALWRAWLDGALPGAPPDAGFVIAGDANLDVADGDGRPGALRGVLTDPRLQDPMPRSPGGVAAAAQGGANTAHQGDPALDTADWRDDGPNDPGNLRVDYVLPSSDWQVVDAGVFWPAPDDPLARLLGEPGAASRHWLVWVDIDRR